jgi:hypothetical protein
MGYPLAGLDDRDQSAQDQSEELRSQRFEQGVAHHDCHVDRPNSCAVSGTCCGMRCSTFRRHHAPAARATGRNQSCDCRAGGFAAGIGRSR